MPQPNSQPSTPLWQRLFSLTLVCALVPVILCALFLLVSSDATNFATHVYTPVTRSVENQLKVSIDANGKRIDTRMQRIGSSILQLQALGEEVLSAPEFYGAFETPKAEGDGEGTEDEAGVLNDSEISLDNPLYYSVGEGGALRKLIDDGGSAVYFADHGGFTTLDMHRVYATAALDPLLIQPVRDDPLCLLSFIITGDNLLRIYPFRDTGSWQPDLDFAKPYSYWNPAKATDEGLVWTAPYRSRFEERWVVACLARVDVGGSTAAIVGCEVPVSALPDELLSFSLGFGGLCWLSMEQQLDDGTAACTVISAQSGAAEFLKLTPVSSASLPDDKKPTEKLLGEADIYRRSPENVAAAMKQAAPVGSSAFVLNPDSGQFLASVNIPSVGWKLSGIIENPAMAAVQAYQQQSNRALERNLIQLGFAVLLSIALAFAVAFIAGRRLAGKITALADQAEGRSTADITATGLAELDRIAAILASRTRNTADVGDGGAKGHEPPSPGD